MVIRKYFRIIFVGVALSAHCRADKNSMFEIKKPITTCGIGFDALPSDVLKSSILTGNDLGQLAGIEKLPNETDVNEYKLIELSELFLSLEDDAPQLEIEIHKKAKLLLEQNLLEEAWLMFEGFGKDFGCSCHALSLTEFRNLVSSAM